MRKHLIMAAFLGVVLYGAPSEAGLCQIIGAQACLDLLDQAINKQSPVEAWATGQYNNYVTRNCQGGPSANTYTFYGRGINAAGDILDKIKPGISCNECEVLSAISSEVGGGYFGQCNPTDEIDWTFVGHFCGLPTGGGAFLYRPNLSLYDAAALFIGCAIETDSQGNVVTTVSACSPSHGCLD